MSQIEESVKNLTAGQIKEIIVRNINFFEMPRILFFTKKTNRITGYLELDGKHYHFELIFPKPGFITVKVGDVIAFEEGEKK